jgi:hypothetical protein
MGKISDADDFVVPECLGHTFAVGRIGYIQAPMWQTSVSCSKRWCV